MGRGLFVVVAVAVVLFVPGRADAAIPLTPCPEAAQVQCGRVAVPLDRSGRTPGTISLHVTVLPAQGPPRGVMFLIAGGPGQGSAGSFDLSAPSLVEGLRYMMPGYTFVAFDNRGTGKSGLLNCPALQAAYFTTAEQGAVLARDCAIIIGPRREFYATRDHAEDLEAVRVALGLNRIGLHGVSYGTKLALAYALAHPNAVERLLLDSVVQPSFPDPLYRNVLRELPGTLGNFCARGICRAATSDFSGEFVALANRLEVRPIRGTIIGTNGRTKTLTLDGEELLSMMIDADLSPGLAAELPAAVHAARGGYVRPLLRLFDLQVASSKLSAEDLSFGLNAATNCADGRFPWAPGTPPGQRRAAIDAALAGLPPGSLGPFGAWSARLGMAYYCEQWPSPTGNTPLGPGPLPDVPVLAVNGGFDLRTPTANARSVISEFPQGQLVVVPGVGHSVLSLDFSGCSQNAVRTWILGTLNAPTRTCPQVAPLMKILGPFPRRPAARSVRSTLAVASRAVREAEATWLQLAFSSVDFTPRGLYGGRLVSTTSGDGGFRLTRYSIAPGVFVSGKLTLADVGPPTSYTGTIRVSGPAAIAGTLRFTRNSVTGRLGGRRVSGRY